MSSSSSSTRGASNATLPAADSGLRRRLGWWWQAPVGLLVTGIVIVLVTSITFGATRPNTGNPPAPADASEHHPSGLFSPIVSPPPQLPAPELPELDAEIIRVSRKYDAVVGITLSQASFPLRAQQSTWYGGTLRSGPAFATIDVAIALAVMADSRRPQDEDYLFNKALADNSAAGDEALWAFLGTPEQAAEKTTQTLWGFGDLRTVVPSVSDVSPNAPYLQTPWALDSQSRLAGTMYCDYVTVHPVLSRLNDPADDPWGLQTIPMTYSKGAWGHTPNGDTMVRQFGVIRLHDGTLLGIAMAAAGTWEDVAAGQGAITELSTAVRRLATGFNAPNC